jgi:hypothetical protein
VKPALIPPTYFLKLDFARSPKRNVWTKDYNIRIAADSTMFLMVNLFIALSLGVQREQFEQRI